MPTRLPHHKRQAVMMSVSFSPEERAWVRRAAYLTERTMSAFIRHAAIKAAERAAQEEVGALPPIRKPMLDELEAA